MLPSLSTMCWVAGPQTHSSTGTVRFDKLAGTALSSTDTHTQTALKPLITASYSSRPNTSRANSRVPLTNDAVTRHCCNKHQSMLWAVKERPACQSAAATLLQCQASSSYNQYLLRIYKNMLPTPCMACTHNTPPSSKQTRSHTTGACTRCQRSNAGAPKWLLHRWQPKKLLDSCRLLPTAAGPLCCDAPAATTVLQLRQPTHAQQLPRVLMMVCAAA